jgi:hypothetical protein
MPSLNFNLLFVNYAQYGIVNYKKNYKNLLTYFSIVNLEQFRKKLLLKKGKQTCPSNQKLS